MDRPGQLAGLIGPCRYRDRGSGTGEGQRDIPADAPTGAGDKCDPIVEPRQDHTDPPFPRPVRPHRSEDPRMRCGADCAGGTVPCCFRAAARSAAWNWDGGADADGHDDRSRRSVESSRRRENIIPKERYVSQDFFDLEMERLWPRVWQMACREEEVPRTGDFLEYIIGDQSILVTRSEPDTIRAFYNTCPHRGTRLASGIGNFATGEIRCRYHAWRFELDGTNKEVVDRLTSLRRMTDADVCLNQIQVGRWGGFVFINMDPHCESLESFLGPLPGAPRALPLREDAVPLLPLGDPPGQLEVGARRIQRELPRPGNPPPAAAVVRRHGNSLRPLGEAQPHGRTGRGEARDPPQPAARPGAGRLRRARAPCGHDRRARAVCSSRRSANRSSELKHQPLPEGMTAMDAYNELRVEDAAAARATSNDLTDEQLLSSDDVHFFPNVVGPIYPGSTTLFRVRPNGLDPDSTIKDLWTLEWVSPDDQREMCERKFYPDWTAKDWGLVTNQDYANMAHVQAGMKSRGVPDFG